MAAINENFLELLLVLQQEPVPVPHDSSCFGVFIENEVAVWGATAEKEGFLSTVTELVEVSLSRILVSIPATIAMIIEVIARYSVNIHPKIP